jgi:hypothetical protein
MAVSSVFMMARGVIAQSALRVWAKYSLQKDLHSVNIKSKLGNKIVDSSDRKVIRDAARCIALRRPSDLGPSAACGRLNE